MVCMYIHGKNIFPEKRRMQELQVTITAIERDQERVYQQ